MFAKKSEEIPTKKALLTILLTTALFSFLLLSLFTFRDLMTSLFSGDRFQIKCVVQHSLSDETLPTSLLVEVMDLSQDHPLNLTLFDTKEAEKRLLKTVAIRRVKVEKMSPNRLYLEYEPRSAIGIVADLTNTFVDEEGVFFPAHPYFTPKRLPEVYFGDECSSLIWGGKIREEKRKILLEIYRLLRKEQISRVDLSRYDHPNPGQREIDLVLRNGTALRLNSLHFQHQLVSFAATGGLSLGKGEELAGINQMAESCSNSFREIARLR